MFSPPLTSSIAFSSAFLVTPAVFNASPVAPLSPTAASRNSSEAMYWSPRFCASLSATLSNWVSSRPIITSPGLPSTFGRRSTTWVRLFLRLDGLPPALLIRPATPPSSCPSRARRTWAGSMYCWSRPRARLWASESASCSLVVNLSNRIGLICLVISLHLPRRWGPGGPHSRQNCRPVAQIPPRPHLMAMERKTQFNLGYLIFALLAMVLVQQWWQRAQTVE